MSKFTVDDKRQAILGDKLFKECQSGNMISETQLKEILKSVKDLTTCKTIKDIESLCQLKSATVDEICEFKPFLGLRYTAANLIKARSNVLSSGLSKDQLDNINKSGRLDDIIYVIYDQIKDNVKDEKSFEKLINAETGILSLLITQVDIAVWNDFFKSLIEVDSNKRELHKPRGTSDNPFEWHFKVLIKQQTMINQLCEQIKKAQQKLGKWKDGSELDELFKNYAQKLRHTQAQLDNL